MAIIVDQPQRVADWVASQYGMTAPAVDVAIGYAVDDEIRAGVYFDGLHGNNIFAHIASGADGIPPALLQAVVMYVFRQVGLERMTFQVPENNFKTVQFVLGLGAVMEARLRAAASEDEDLLLFVLWAGSPLAQRLIARSEKFA